MKKLFLVLPFLFLLNVIFIPVAWGKKIDVFELAENGTPKQIREAINAGVNFNVSDEEFESASERNETPLHVAAAFNHNPEVIRILIQQGLGVNDQAGYYKNSYTPLFNAIEYGNIEAVKELLKHGADPFEVGTFTVSSFKGVIDLRDKNNSYATSKKLDDKTAKIIIEALVNAGGNLDKQWFSDDKTIKFLTYDKWEEYSNIEKDFLKRSTTALMFAVRADDPFLVNLFLDLGADPTLKNLENKTALDYGVQLPYISKIKTSEIFEKLKSATEFYNLRLKIKTKH